ncbi:hypothetical protein AURDEDRAFT_124547 [Auricularia subglabra TFB-10046 SS5]|nr:hypothetical protein AURDEDRAFT_124547 [Auricularia subglabra TFB-10046 SS5]
MALSTSATTRQAPESCHRMGASTVWVHYHWEEASPRETVLDDDVDHRDGEVLDKMETPGGDSGLPGTREDGDGATRKSRRRKVYRSNGVNHAREQVVAPEGDTGRAAVFTGSMRMRATTDWWSSGGVIGHDPDGRKAMAVEAASALQADGWYYPVESSVTAAVAALYSAGFEYERGMTPENVVHRLVALAEASATNDVNGPGAYIRLVDFRSRALVDTMAAMCKERGTASVMANLKKKAETMERWGLAKGVYIGETVDGSVAGRLAEDASTDTSTVIKAICRASTQVDHTVTACAIFVARTDSERALAPWIEAVLLALTGTEGVFNGMFAHVRLPIFCAVKGSPEFAQHESQSGRVVIWHKGAGSDNVNGRHSEDGTNVELMAYFGRTLCDALSLSKAWEGQTVTAADTSKLKVEGQWPSQLPELLADARVWVVLGGDARRALRGFLDALGIELGEMHPDLVAGGGPMASFETGGHPVYVVFAISPSWSRHSGDLAVHARRQVKVASALHVASRLTGPGGLDWLGSEAGRSMLKSASRDKSDAGPCSDMRWLPDRLDSKRRLDKEQTWEIVLEAGGEKTMSYSVSSRWGKVQVNFTAETRTRMREAQAPGATGPVPVRLAFDVCDDEGHAPVGGMRSYIRMWIIPDDAMPRIVSRKRVEDAMTVQAWQVIAWEAIMQGLVTRRSGEALIQAGLPTKVSEGGSAGLAGVDSLSATDVNWTGLILRTKVRQWQDKLKRAVEKALEGVVLHDRERKHGGLSDPCEPPSRVLLEDMRPIENWGDVPEERTTVVKANHKRDCRITGDLLGSIDVRIPVDAATAMGEERDCQVYFDTTEVDGRCMVRLFGREAGQDDAYAHWDQWLAIDCFKQRCRQVLAVQCVLQQLATAADARDMKAAFEGGHVVEHLWRNKETGPAVRLPPGEDSLKTMLLPTLNAVRSVPDAFAGC